MGIGRKLRGRWRMVGLQLKGKKECPPNLHLIWLYNLKRRDQNVNLDGLFFAQVVCPHVGNISVSL